MAPWFFGRYGDRIVEPEINFVFAVMFGLMYLGGQADSRPCSRSSCSAWR
jgi:hypothetical protein